MGLITIREFQDSDNTILGIAHCLNAITGPDDSDVVEFDFSSCKWLQIGEITALASYLRSLKSSGRRFKGRFANGEVLHYLERMDFFAVQDIVREISFVRHEADSKLLALTEIDESANANEIPAKLRNIVAGRTAIDKSLICALDYAFGEIVDNVLTHSRSARRGIVGAQYYPKKGFVEFCVADCGIGVAESLRRNSRYEEEANDAVLLLKSFEEGVGENTSSFGDDVQGYGCGFGLTFAARLVERTGGDLWMTSNHAGVHIGSGGRDSITGIAVPGTVVCARIPSDVAVAENDLMMNGVDAPYSWNLDEAEGDSGGGILW